MEVLQVSMLSSRTQTKASSSVSSAGSSTLSDLAGGQGRNVAYAAKTYTRLCMARVQGFIVQAQTLLLFLTLLHTSGNAQAGPLAAPYRTAHYVPVVAQQTHTTRCLTS